MPRRDSKYFLDRGYRVTSIDGSLKMCELASKYIVNDVQCKRFDEIDYEHEFDGIWASASLLYIPKKDLKSIFKMLYKALKDNGYMYVSFKYGKYEGEVDGRYFTYLEHSDLLELVNEDFEILVEMETEDLRLESCNSKWVNVILKKVVNYDKSVYVGEGDDFHRLFEVEDRDVHEHRGLSTLGGFCGPRLWDLYRKILKYI